MSAELDRLRAILRHDRDLLRDALEYQEWAQGTVLDSVEAESDELKAALHATDIARLTAEGQAPRMDAAADTPTESMGNLDIFLEGGQHMRFIDPMPILRRANDLVTQGIHADEYHAVRLTFTESSVLVRLAHISAIVLRED